ncbi:MobF family relaxase [Actinomadura atramentaria]|uniref:MobF family relaxase n=1 Tax=Actinomadura atramentaria TaxID=1990 RepID=UPI00037A553C|nr:MobF family relaxase [Actinomadura atramentaria]
MTIHKLTAGDGYTYLTRQVANADVDPAWERGQAAAEYYTARGNPPGRWVGRGAPLLGLEGEEVTEDQMKALYGVGMHPDADRLVSEYLDQHLRAGMTDKQVTAVQDRAVKAATLGRKFPAYSPISPFDKRVKDRLAQIERETGRTATATDRKRVLAEESRRARAAVSGFDVVFAPVKSAALLWAMDPRAEVRRAVRQAHEAARDAALELLEEQAALTRTGQGGVAQTETRGLIAAMFDHYDSRSGDPNLHTHVAISSKIQGIDGVWRSLDARALYRIAVAASEFYNSAFEVELRQRLPVVSFAERTDTVGAREPIREIAGVPEEFIENFSARRTDIEARYEYLLRQYRREHGRDPSRQVAHDLARRANLDTRDPKKAARSLDEMRADWTQQLIEHFGAGAVGRLMDGVPDEHRGAPDVTHGDGGRDSPTPARQADLVELARRVVANVAEMRSTWTVWNLRAEAERLTRAELLFSSPEEHRGVVARIVERAVSPALSVRVDAPAVLDEPTALRRSDGASVFTEHASLVYTSRQILDAEDRLVRAARTPTAVALSGQAVAAALTEFDALIADAGMALDAGQRALVTAFACDDRLVVAGLGPAGAGKTTAMKAYAHVAARSGQRIVALATSSAAADVLGQELDLRADNLHKFLFEYTDGPHAALLRDGGAGAHADIPPHKRQFVLRPGDVVLVDEAGMAGTPALDRLVAIAAQRGAVVRLLGDHRQLGAVESGGALRLIATDVGAAELTTLYRFADPAEAEATLRLRVGDASGLDFYLRNKRVQSGSRQAMIEEAYAGWKADMLAGKTTLLAASTSVNVGELNAQARRDRVEAGQVEPDGAALHDGNTAGVRDWIVTRANDRRLRTRGTDWVKNGDAWIVTARHDDGSLTVRHLNHGGAVRLPAAYVGADVELMYATTTNRAQGSTVDTAHPLVTPDMTRENLYVVASRARERTVLHVVTHELLSYDPDDRLDRVRHDARQYAAREVLENVLAREGNELSATESIRESTDLAASLATLAPRHQHVATLLATATYTGLAREVLPRPLARVLTDCDGWPQIVTALARAETLGWNARDLLLATARDGDLLTADTPARLVAWRIGHHTEQHPAPGPIAQPTLADAARYAALLHPAAGDGRVLDPAEALRRPVSRTARRAASTYVSIARVQEYADAVAAALSVPVTQVTAHRTWPHLAAALAAADRNGRDVPGFLGTLTATLTARSSEPAIRPTDILPALSRTVRRLVAADPAAGPITLPDQLRHAGIAATALGITEAERLRADASWPALSAALRRAADHGHDPAVMLRRVADARDYSTADSGSRVLAWRLNRYVQTLPVQANVRRANQDWRLLAWTLKALEERGVAPADLVRVGDDLHDVLTTALETASDHSRPANDAPLSWLASITPQDDHDPTLVEYLHNAADAIATRVRHVTDDALRSAPAWLAALGPAPDDPLTRAEWSTHVSTVAAYRDQQRVPTNDPRRVLGAYIETGRPNHDAYWHAASAIAAARRITGLDPAVDPISPARARLIADHYLALPDEDRAALYAALVERRGDLWFGDPTALDDHAVTHPLHARDLHDLMIQRGHLTAPTAEETTTEPSADRRPASVEPPVEAVRATHRETQEDAERAARIQAARRANQRELNRSQRRGAPRQRRRQPARTTEQPPPIHQRPVERTEERRLEM